MNYHKVRKIEQNIQGVSGNSSILYLLGKAAGAVLKRAQ
jgi:hypothetical protein